MRSFRVMSILFILFLLSCNTQMKFDKTKWRELSQDDFYQYRGEMLKDLLDNYKLIGMKFTEIHELLGKSDDGGPHESEYNISENYSFLAKHTIKMLHLNFNDDSIVTSIKILENEDD